MNLAASTLVARRTEVSNLRSDLENKHILLTREKERNEQLQIQFSQIKQNAGSTEVKALQVC